MIPELRQSIQDKSAHIGVIGLGYVGLPVACVIARSGFRVTGIDVDAERIATINGGQSPIGGDEPGISDLIADVVGSGRLHATTDYTELGDARLVVLCMDTPVEPDTHLPAYRGLRSALASLGPVLRSGALVIVESTIAPGTMTGLVIPELERTSGKRAGQDFYVGHCPERVMPGLLLHNLTAMNRTVGAQTAELAQIMRDFYGHFVTGDLDPADLLTAEIVKTAENAYRDVQIAFANELALICEALGADVYSVRELVNKSPGRAVLLPGAGVGGHCIPKDPWLLIANVGQAYQAELIPAARAVNTQMPDHMVELLEKALTPQGISIQGARIAVLGYAYREDTDDDRNSPSSYLAESLRQRGSVPVIHDPYVPEYKISLEAALKGAHAAVLMVAHRAYRNLDLALVHRWMACPVLVDGRNVVDAMTARQIGFTYLGVGKRIS